MNAQTVDNILILHDKIRFGLGNKDADNEKLIEYIQDVCCRDTSYCNNITIAMIENQTLSHEIRDIDGVNHLCISLSNGSETCIPLSSIGDKWGDQVIQTDVGLSGAGTASNKLGFTQQVKDRLQTATIAIQEINLDQRAFIPALPFDGKVKYVVPPELQGYRIESVSVFDSNSNVQVLRNGIAAQLGQTTVSAGDVLSLKVTAIGAELTATIILKSNLT